MLRDSKRNRVTVLPTMAARPAAPEAPGNPEPARSARRDATPRRGRNTTTSPSPTSVPRQAPAIAKPATAPLPGDKPATMAARPVAPLGTPADTRPAWRRLKIAPIAACLLALAAGWWVRGEVENQVKMISPGMRAGDDLAQIQQALQLERDKAGKLARDLDTAWREVTSQAVALADNAAQHQELTDLRQALNYSEGQSAAYEELLEQERARTRGLEEQLASRPDGAPRPGPNAKASPSATPDPTPSPATYKAATAAIPPDDKPAMPARDKPAAMPVRPAALEAPGIPETARLMARASLLLDQGNIGVARVVLERATETGSALALFALAETYDPVSLSAWGTFGTQGDVAKAQDLYARAYAGGVQEAKDRLNALR